MTPDEFAALVRRMRAKQTEYFRERKPSVLNECRDLERRVDRALDEKAVTPGLFGGGEPT